MRTRWAEVCRALYAISMRWLCCRYPYLTSSSAGVALQETVKKADLASLGARLTAGLAAGAWTVPTLILTGDADKFIEVLREA